MACFIIFFLKPGRARRIKKGVSKCDNFLFSFAPVIRKSGNMSPVTQVGVVKSILCLLLIIFSLGQSMAGHDCTVKAIKKVNGKETTVFTIKSSVLPSS